MNQFIGIGRLTKDPEVRYSQDGKGVARFTLAVDRPKREGQEQTADFPTVVAFGKNAEFTEKYLKKGTKILVEGRLQTGSYEKNGQKIYTTDIVAERFEFVESKASTVDSKINATIVTEEFSDIPVDEMLPFMQPTR